MTPVIKWLNLRTTLTSNIPIITVLLGAALVTVSIGPFQNPDTTWEFKAASGVVTWGMPFVEVQGSLINQPPLGFYAQGLFLSIFGVSIESGVFLVRLFGLGCILMVYLLGKELYGKPVGVLASALFALAPWQMVLSNAFLIDTQCVFLSLSALYAGLLSFKDNSNKLLFVAGVLFALAFYTKLFAVFTLIPLFLFYLYLQPKQLRSLHIKLPVFFLPLVVATLVWYMVVFYMMPSYLPRDLGYMFIHSDFDDLNPVGVAPSINFVGNFLVNYGLGYLFVAAVSLSVILGLSFRKQICKKALAADLIFTAAILLVLGLILYLGFSLNLKVPYTSTIKYAYQTLPFFCLLAASLAVKSFTILRTAQLQHRLRKAVFVAAGFISVLLPPLALLVNVYSVNLLSMVGFIVFRVEPDQLLGYSFDNFTPVHPDSPLLNFQYVGFILILCSLLYWVRELLGVFRLKQSTLNHQTH